MRPSLATETSRFAKGFLREVVGDFLDVSHVQTGARFHFNLTLDLPEGVAHIAGPHSAEGELVKRSLEATMIRWADHSFWMIIEQGGCYPTRILGCRR